LKNIFQNNLLHKYNEPTKITGNVCDYKREFPCYDFTEETHGVYNSEFARYSLKTTLTYVVDA